jgi:hypothetical protein
VNRPFSGSETLPTRFLTPENPWAEHTFMAAMAMVWEPLTKTKFKVSLKNGNFGPFFKSLLLAEKWS